jgi:hypothetical protein
MPNRTTDLEHQDELDVRRTTSRPSLLHFHPPRTAAASETERFCRSRDELGLVMGSELAATRSTASARAATSRE